MSKIERFVNSISAFSSSLKKLYAHPDHMTLAFNELEEAKRSLLQALSAKEYAASLAVYHEGRVQRLKQYIQSVQDEENCLDFE